MPQPSLRSVVAQVNQVSRSIRNFSSSSSRGSRNVGILGEPARYFIIRHAVGVTIGYSLSRYFLDVVPRSLDKAVKEINELRGLKTAKGKKAMETNE